MQDQSTRSPETVKKDKPRHPQDHFLDVTEKYCRVCKLHKPLSAFGVCRSAKDGHYTYCLACANEKTRRYNREHPDRVLDCVLRRNYGLTLVEYTEILNAQGGVCAICGTPANRDGRRLYVDHEHRSGAIRGLLCHDCNNALSLFQENPTVLQAAIDYLSH